MKKILFVLLLAINFIAFPSIAGISIENYLKCKDYNNTKVFTPKQTMEDYIEALGGGIS